MGVFSMPIEVRHFYNRSWCMSSRIMILFSRSLKKGLFQSRGASGATPEGLPANKIFNWFIYNAISGWSNLVSGNCSRICNCKSLAFQQPSTP
jgi:hypothetical protein